MNNLDHNYNSETLLSKWWDRVKSNFKLLEQHTKDAVLDHPDGSVIRDKLSTAVKSELDGLRTDVNKKAAQTYVDTELAKKASVSYVNTELAKKADAAAVNTELLKKADLSYVDAELAEKADQSTIGDLSDLLTTVKTNIVAAVNAVYSKVKRIFIDDTDGFIGIGFGAETQYNNIAIGKNANSNQGGSGHVAIGEGAESGGEASTAIGSFSSAGSGNFPVSLGNGAAAKGNFTCQLGKGTNETPYTTKIYDYQLTSSDGGTEEDTKQYLTDVGKLGDLPTENKNCIVAAIVELESRIAALEGNA